MLVVKRDGAMAITRIPGARACEERQREPLTGYSGEPIGSLDEVRQERRVGQREAPRRTVPCQIPRHGQDQPLDPGL